MFQKDSPEKSSSSAETVIGPSVKVEGDLKGVGSVIIEGELKGLISTDKEVTIGDNAIVHASIDANKASIAGKVTGNITVKDHLEITSSAKIDGDIKTKTISIESGATINGGLSMGGHPAPQQNKTQPNS